MPAVKLVARGDEIIHAERDEQDKQAPIERQGTALQMP